MLLNSYTANGEIFIHQGSAYFTQVVYTLEEYLLVVQQPVEYNGDPEEFVRSALSPGYMFDESAPSFRLRNCLQIDFQEIIDVLLKSDPQHMSTNSAIIGKIV